MRLARGGPRAGVFRHIVLFAMIPLRILGSLIVLFGLLTGPTLTAADKQPLQLERLELTDGRKLRDVVVRSFDAEKGRLLLVASGKAMLLSIELLPEPVRTRVKEETPEAGGTTNTSPPAANPTPPERPRTPPVPPPEPARNGQPAFDPRPHVEAAKDRADRFYRFEHFPGSATLSLRVAKFETDDPEPLTGWPNRYRVQGRAFLEYYETKNYTTIRSIDRFEIITEQKGTRNVQVLDFTRK
jgi:hypothetical protein